MYKNLFSTNQQNHPCDRVPKALPIWQQRLESAQNSAGLGHFSRFSPGIGYDVMWIPLQLWYIRGQVRSLCSQRSKKTRETLPMC